MTNKYIKKCQVVVRAKKMDRTSRGGVVDRMGSIIILYRSF